MSERACRFTSLWATVIAGALASACSSDAPGDDAKARDIELHFDARWRQTPFGCGSLLDGIGKSGSTAEPLDLRFYVHDVMLVRDDEQAVPFVLSADDEWQSTQVALLDFEDGSGRCDRGTQATNTVLRGRAPQHSDYVGLGFTLGVPPELNHLDLSTAAAPLDVPGMWWSWQGGYKYVRAELATPQNPDGFLFHLGATSCAGSPANGYACERQNLPRITLVGDTTKPVTLDVAALFGSVDLSQKPDLATDLVPGCMSDGGDPECPPLFATLGLPVGEQEVFSLP